MKLEYKNFYLILSCFVIIFIYGCSSKNKNKIKKPDPIPSVEELYRSGYEKYTEGKYRDSLKLFKKIETRYSFSEFAPRALMMIMFIYYENNDEYNSLEYASKFKKLFPLHKNIDYVDFIVASNFYERIQVTSRDQTYSKVALEKFQNIIKKYPDSIYADESIYKIDLINEQLAGKHIYIARYYMNTSKWIAAIKRLDIVVNNYSSTIYITEALHRLVEIYYHLGNINEAKKYAAILGYNFNDSDWYKKTYKIVGDQDYTEENKETKRKLKDRLIELFKFLK
jgi:outer membrane protein assembly factor BamD